MATKNQAAGWLEWADKQLAANGGNSRPSNWDKATAPFLIKEYKTWQEVYDAARANYIEAGGTEEEVTVHAPIKTKSETAKKKKVAATAAEAAAEVDPFGEAAINKYGLTVDVDENGNQSIRGILPGTTTAVPMYIYTSTSTGIGVSTPGDSVGTPKPVKDDNIYVSQDYNAIRNQILKDAQASPGGLDALLDKLYNSGVITKATYQAKNISAPDFAKGLQYLVTQYSIAAVNDYSVYGNKAVNTFDNFMAKDFKGAGSTSKTTYDMVVTTRQDAADEANQFFMQYLGRTATKAEHDDYFKQLNAAEKKAIRYTTTSSEGNQVTKGELMTETDRALVLGKVAGNAIKGTDIEQLMKSGAGAAQDVDSILAYARNYGVKVSREQATRYIADNLREGSNIDATKAKIVEISRSNYKNFSDKISKDISVKELASNYVYQKAETLELNPEAIDIFDGDIQDAINGNISMTDFNVRLRQNPGWAKTKNAKEEAAKYATSILESFGLMA